MSHVDQATKNRLESLDASIDSISPKFESLSGSLLPDVPPFPRALPHTTICIDPIALITQECITITTAMRKQARWSQSTVSAILGGGASRLQETEISRPSSRASGKQGKSPMIASPGSTPLLGAAAADDDGTLASRWGLRGKKGKSLQDNPLLSAFARLRRDLAGCKDVSTVDAPELLHPFLQVIRSSSTSATITSLAVISITKFFSYDLITVRSPRMSLAMQLLGAAITHCRFEASDTSADEVVLLRILRLMESIITRPEGQLLGDESICEMMGTGLSMCCQARLSEVLRRSAEMAMVTMCQVVFGRLKTIEVEKIEAPPTRSRSNTLHTTVTNVEEPKIEPSLNGSVMAGMNTTRPSSDGESRASIEAVVEARKADAIVEQQVAAQMNEEYLEDVKPYALPSIKELFRVLIDLLDPHNKTHTDPMRVMALRILDVALEVAGPSIAAQPSLAALVQDDLCRHLFQLVRSDNALLLNSSLRAAGTLLATCRQLLKLQQELFLSYLVACLHPRVDIPQEPGIDPSLYEGIPQAPKLVKPAPSQPSSGRSTPVPVKDRRQLGLEGGSRRPEAREAMVESIGTLIRMPTFMIELFVNYDCEVDGQDLCEDMVGLLSRNAFPDSVTWSTTSVPPLCLDSLLTFVQSLAERIDLPHEADREEQIRQLRARRVRKRLIRSGAAKFNDEPKAGIAYLVKNGIIDDPDDPEQVARFLKGTSHVSKKQLGEFLTKKSNERLLTAFISMFEFGGKRIDEALRDMLGTFRLPGESALIERIVSIFTEKYCSTTNSNDITDKDAAFVLTYAIIMLNTELYNPNVKSQKRMTHEDFAKNLRGVNGGKDFAMDYLREIYDAIKQNEIILPDEHDNKHAFDYAWKELLVKTRSAGDLRMLNTNTFDSELFNATWKPIIATLSYVFLSASDDAVFSRVILGFDQCARLAAKYQVTEAFDRIVYSLSQISGLASELPPSTSLNTEVQAGQKKIMVSELAVRLGRDMKAQLATVLLFRILTGHEEAVGTTWVYIVRTLKNLFINSLITMPKIETSDLIAALDPIPLQPPSQIIDRDGRMNESGLFSTFTSYLSSYAADDPPEPSEEELENTLSAVDCVKACQTEAVLVHLFTLPTLQIKALVSALISELDDSSPVVTVKPDLRPAPVTVRVNGHRLSRNGPEYDPGSVFLLEFATMLTTRDRETVAAAGEVLTGALQTAIRDAANMHPLATSRIVHYLMDLLRLSFSNYFMRAPVVLHAISSFNDTVLDNAAVAVMQGLSSCISHSPLLRNEITASPDFWSILQRLHQHKTEAEKVFDLLVNIASSQSSAVTADNYESTVTLASEFASAGRIGSIQEQRRELAARRGKQVKQGKTEENVVVQRGIKAINIIYHLTNRIPTLIQQSHLERHEAWAAYWSPIFQSLSSQCVNPCRDIRNRAISALQRTLLSEELAEEGHSEWTAIFGDVLFPLVLRLLKPEIYKLDPVGMNDTRVQAATLLCKIFLRYLDHLVSCGRMLEVWTKVLDLLDRMMNVGVEGEALGEAVMEGVKNVILVMAGSGYLKQQPFTFTSPRLPQLQNLSRPRSSLSTTEAASGSTGDLKAKEKASMESSTSQDTEEDDDQNGNNPTQDEVTVWVETVKRVDRFLPGLMREVFPPLTPQPQQRNSQQRQQHTPASSTANTAFGSPAGSVNAGEGGGGAAVAAAANSGTPVTQSPHQQQKGSISSVLSSSTTSGSRPGSSSGPTASVSAGTSGKSSKK